MTQISVDHTEAGEDIMLADARTLLISSNIPSTSAGLVNNFHYCNKNRHFKQDVSWLVRKNTINGEFVPNIPQRPTEGTQPKPLSPTLDVVS